MKNTLKKLGFLILLLTSYQWAAAQGGGAELELRSSVDQPVKDQSFSVDIVLLNPDQQNVISVRSWLTYDPAVLEAERIESSASPFDLAAPGENNISVGEGRIKIGRSNITGGVAVPETTVATVQFKVLAANAVNTTVDFFDYQVSELGHTNVNIIDGGFPLNILSNEPNALNLSVNPGATAPAPTPTPTPVPQPTPQPVPQPDIGTGPVFEAGLNRPENVMINTGNGYVDLKWDADTDPNRTGFNIYYGKQSGSYTRRRTVPNVNSYRLDGLNNGETMYFAVTAYDNFNRESDYSNEVGVIINQPLSSTAPFASILTGALGRVPTQPQNGPLTWWLAITSIGLAGAFMFKPKQIQITNES